MMNVINTKNGVNTKSVKCVARLKSGLTHMMANLELFVYIFLLAVICKKHLLLIYVKL